MSPARARDAQLPQKGSYILWDTKTPYLGLRVHAGGGKVWIVQKKLGKSPCRVNVGDFPNTTHAKACSLVAEVVAKISKGIDPNLEKRQQIRETAERRTQETFTVKRCFEEYIADKNSAGTPKPLSITDWQRSLARIAAGSLGSIPLASLSGRLLADYYDVSAKKAKRLATNDGRTQAGRDLRYLRAAYNLCALKFNLKLPAKSPFKELNRMRDSWYLVASKTRIIGGVEGGLEKWWKAVEGMRPSGKPQQSRDVLADYLELSLLWGVRRGELLSLPWDAVSLDDGVVRVAGTETKNAMEHLFPISNYARQLLQKRHALNFAMDEPCPWVFPSPMRNSAGVRSHIVEASRAIAFVKARSGYDFSAHDLRRTFATIFNEMGAGEYSVKRALNHAAHDTASKHYIKTRIAKLRPLYQQYEDNLLTEAGVLLAEDEPKLYVSAQEYSAFQTWLAGQAK